MPDLAPALVRPVPAPNGDRTGRPHGYSRYKIDGCRCYACCWAQAQYYSAVQQAKQRGTWQPYVDAEPARQHILDLKACGLGDRSIAAQAHVDRKRIRDLLHGRPERGTPPPPRIPPPPAAALLAVEATLDTLPDRARVNAVGTQRRLLALAAAGWPLARLAAALGMAPGNFSRLIHHTPTVYVHHARAVRDLYDQLWRADPRGHGVDNQAYSRALNQARANQWAPVGAWDEDTIDDPAARPDWTGRCGTVGGYRDHEALGTPACERCTDAHNRQVERCAA